MQKIGFLVAFFGITLLASHAAKAALIVSLDNHTVVVGTTVIETISVTNSTAAASSDIEGMVFTFQIAGGAGSAPKITGMDLLSGTVWAGHVSAANISTPLGGDLFQYKSRDLLTDLPADFINANGLLAKITIDTSGALPGDYSLKLIGTSVGGRDSVFLDGLGGTVPGTFGQGTLTLTVPEPGSLLLLGSGLMLAFRKGKSQGKWVTRATQPG